MSFTSLLSRAITRDGEDVEVIRGGVLQKKEKALYVPHEPHFDMLPKVDVRAGDVVSFLVSEISFTVIKVEKNVIQNRVCSLQVYYREIDEFKRGTTVIHNHGVMAGSLVNSAIQQNSPGATQNLSIGVSDSDRLKAAIKVVLEALNSLSLEKEVEAEVRADLQTAKAQLESPKPKTGFIKGILGAAWEKVKEKAIEKAVDPAFKVVGDAWNAIGEYVTT